MNPLLRLGIGKLGNSFRASGLMALASLAIAFSTNRIPIEVAAAILSALAFLLAPCWSGLLILQLDGLSRLAPISPSRRLRTFFAWMSIASLWGSLWAACLSHPWSSGLPRLGIHFLNIFLTQFGGSLGLGAFLRVSESLPPIARIFVMTLLVGVYSGSAAIQIFNPGMWMLLIILLPLLACMATIFWQLEDLDSPAGGMPEPATPQEVARASDSTFQKTEGPLESRSFHASPTTTPEVLDSGAGSAVVDPQSKGVEKGRIPAVTLMWATNFNTLQVLMMLLTFGNMLPFYAILYGRKLFDWFVGINVLANITTGIALSVWLSFITTPYPRWKAFWIILTSPLLVLGLAVGMVHWLAEFEPRLMEMPENLVQKKGIQLHRPPWLDLVDNQATEPPLIPTLEKKIQADTIGRFLDFAFGMHVSADELLALHPGDRPENPRAAQVDWIKAVENRYEAELRAQCAEFRIFVELMFACISLSTGLFYLPAMPFVSKSFSWINIGGLPIAVGTLFVLIILSSKQLNGCFTTFHRFPALYAVPVLLIISLVWRHYLCFRRWTLDRGDF